MNTIRILADDLTGALDAAAMFSGNIPVFIDKLPEANECGAIEAKNAPVVVLATDTRDVPLESLDAILSPALAWFSKVPVSFKKIDSLLRGNTVAEAAWLFKHGGFERCVFAPAFPAQGRITQADQHWVEKSIGKDTHREAIGLPISKAFLPYALSVGNRIDPDRAKVWAPNVLTQDDLYHIGKHSQQSPNWLWCGSAGLALALSENLGLKPQPRQTPLETPAGAHADLLISASFQSTMKTQWHVLQEAFAEKSFIKTATIQTLIEGAKAIGKGQHTAYINLSPEQTLSQKEASILLQEQTAVLIEHLPKPRQLMVIGGDTLLSLCRSTHTQALLAQSASRNGWGCARFLGGKWDGVPCYTRSGAFGKADDLLAMARWLHYQ